MLTRVAVFEGSLEPGSEDAFFADVTARLEPVWRSFPHVRRCGSCARSESDHGAIPVVMVLEMDFASMADIQAHLEAISQYPRQVDASLAYAIGSFVTAVAVPSIAGCGRIASKYVLGKSKRRTSNGASNRVG